MSSEPMSALDAENEFDHRFYEFQAQAAALAGTVNLDHLPSMEDWHQVKMEIVHLRRDARTLLEAWWALKEWESPLRAPDLPSTRAALQQEVAR